MPKITIKCEIKELKFIYSKLNKTGLQPVSRPAEQILGFFQKVLMQKMVQKKCSKNV